MKKITDFIVNKRYIILIVCIILAIVCFILSQKVNINYDIAKYLPKTTQTRIGMDIMEEEFAGSETSYFNLVFKGLGDSEKYDIYNYLNELNGVSSIDYDETEEYNKDDYTLYVINVDADSDSELATNVYNKVIEHYKDYEIYTGGDIAERNTPVLAEWIVVLAVGCALIILIIMCESYVEPFLFLFSILIAVLFNKGTNIIFPYISNITESIAAILQLALSMDYSIMLMNRYNQEKKKEQDKVVAMKNALYNAFKSISSSSITTIVGLIVLVFMSFTIGRDLGLILAKGVFFSLISIFFVLPGLILIFDKWIVKTKKKSINIKLNKVGEISYKLRYISIPVFLIIFIASFILKGNLGILYTNSEDDKTNEFFKVNNQMALIYKNEDEEKIAQIVSTIENDEKVKEVLAYSNTINEELYYDDFKQKLNDLGSEINIEDYLLKMLYYDYYSKDIENNMTFEEFVDFIKNDVYNNKDIEEKIDSNTRKDIDRLENFIHESTINKKRTASEISQIMDIDEDKIKDILIYYSAKNNNIKININEFVNFIEKDVLTDTKYASKIDETSREKLNSLSKYISKTTIQKEMTVSQIASLFEINEDQVSDLYKYYVSENEINEKMTISEFSTFVLEDVLNDENYANMFDENTISNIKLLATFSNKNIINNNISSEEISELFGIDKRDVLQILYLKYSNMDDESSMTISNFIKNVVYIKNNTNYLENVNIDNIESLYTFANNENNINTTKMDKVHLSYIFDKINEGLVNNIYLLSNMPDTTLMSPQEFINLVINLATNAQENSENNIEFNVEEETLNKLKLLKMVIDDSINSNGERYTSSQLSDILEIPKNNIQQLYALINMVNGNTSNWNITPYEFVKLILENSNNENIKSNINEENVNKLNLLYKIMNSTINDSSYTYNEIADFIGINQDSAKNIYTLYIFKVKNIKITPIEFVKFILNHINDEKLLGKFSTSQVNELQLINKIMEDVLNNKKYTKQEMSDLLGIDKEKTELIYGLYDSKYINKNYEISLNEFIEFILNNVITNKEYSESFNEQMIQKLRTINNIMKASLNKQKYSSNEIFAILSILSDDVEENTVKLLYTYYGSENEYNNEWKLTIEEFVRYLNENILEDSRFTDFINDDKREQIIDAKDKINDAKELLIAKNYSRVVINTKFDPESEETFEFIKKLEDLIKENNIEGYVIGNSSMAYEMSGTFNNEMNFITILTMISIFVVVAITFKSLLVPIILVFIIQCAVYITMVILHITGDKVYFISLLIVQSILMGATIDYAILYTSYYLEHRKTMSVREAVINSYNKSIHTILNSSSILIIVTLIVAKYSSAIASKICKTISEGTLCSTILILLLLPAMLATCDRFLLKNKK